MCVEVYVSTLGIRNCFAAWEGHLCTESLFVRKLIPLECRHLRRGAVSVCLFATNRFNVNGADLEIPV